MENSRSEQKFDFKVADLIEALYDEVDELEMPEATKGIMVTLMLGDVLKREGRYVSFQLPVHLETWRQVA